MPQYVLCDGVDAIGTPNASCAMAVTPQYVLCNGVDAIGTPNASCAAAVTPPAIHVFLESKKKHGESAPGWFFPDSATAFTATDA